VPWSLFLCLAIGAGSHPESLSRTRVVVQGAEARVELRCDALSLLELEPALDVSGDGWLDDEEALAAVPLVGAYLAEHLWIECEACEPAGRVPGEIVAIRPQARDAVGPLDLQKVEVSLRYRAPQDLETFVLGSTLFRERNPWHRDFASVVWNGAEAVHHAFEGDQTTWRFEPAHVRRPGVVATFVRLGVDHILGGWDHLAFVLALLVASRRLRSLLGVVTAFTLAHSLTLALAALDVVHLPSRVVELAIALSIAYVGVENCLAREARTPWIEAFGFGLLHGLGFAGFLGDALAGEPLVLAALLGFNLGVEFGQLAVVLLCLVLLAGLRRAWRGTERPGHPELVPRPVRLAISAVVAALGLFWFVQRAGWIG
jgi:hydrogenase/urease accessory protein HupE